MGRFEPRFATACLMLLFVAGCATQASGPAFAPLKAKGGGVIYVYAPQEWFGGYGISPTVEIDGKSAGKLNAKGYLARKVSAGEHTVTLRGPVLGIGKDRKATVRSGSSTYLRVVPEFYTMSGLQPIYLNHISVVSNAVGRREIRATRSSD